MNVSFINFPDNDSSKLQKILQLSKTNIYTICPFDPYSEMDFLFFYGDNYWQQKEFNSLPKEQYSRVIVVAKQAPRENACHFLSLPLMASRVLNLLDKINEKPILVDDISNLKPMVNKQSADQIFDSHFHSNDELDLGFYILVVDDSVPMQKALTAEIKKLEKPTKIDFADTGEQALLYVERNNYDFIFLDIVMPGIDGFETCTRMRKIPKLKKTPIIMLSAKTSPLDEVKGVMAGCTTYMTKPIVHEEFQKVISRISKWIETVYKKDSVS